MDSKIKLYLLFVVAFSFVVVFNYIFLGNSPSSTVIEEEEQIIEHITGIEVDLNPEIKN